MYEGGDGKNRKTFPRISDEPSKPQNFSPSKTFVVYGILNMVTAFSWSQQLDKLGQLKLCNISVTLELNV